MIGSIACRAGSSTSTLWPARPVALPRRVAAVLALAVLACGAAIAESAEAAKDPLAGLRPRGGEKPEQPADSVEPPADGRARTSLFGLTGEGFKFVYVFDRSGSMGGSAHEALRAVKAELRNSLQNLDTVHQFQIIFYNDRPVVFNPSGVQGRLAFANPQTKQRALRFVETISADGGTEHEEALKLAIRLRPDVIFFLTDGDDPKLTRPQLDRIQRMAAGITINAIEFGSGPRPEGESFLATLAEENDGQYVYVDITKLGRKEARSK